MNYFICAFLLRLRQNWQDRGRRFLTALMLVLTAVMLILPASPADAVVQVGLVVPEGQGEALTALLMERSSQLVRFVPTDEATLERRILSGSWDCGLVLPEDFDQRLKALDSKNLVTLKTGPGSTIYPLVRETVSACLMELMAPYIAEAFLQEHGVDQALMDLPENDQWVQVHLQTVDGASMDPLTMTASGIRRLLVGLAALGTLVLGLYLAMDLGAWREGEMSLRLRSIRRETELLLPRLAADLLPVLLWGVLVLPLLFGSWYTAPAFVVYCGVIGGLALAVSRVPPLWRAVPVLSPFLAVGCLIFEPILVDVSSLFPRLSPWTAWLPLGTFLRAAGGSLPDLAGLTACGAVFFGVSLLLDRIPGKMHKKGLPF